MNLRIALSFNLFLASAHLVFAQDAGPHPAGIVSVHVAPASDVASISIDDFREGFPGSPIGWRSKAGALLCGRGFCGGPYLNARGMTTIDGEIYAVEEDATSSEAFLTKFAAGLSHERVGVALGFPNIEALAWTGSKLVAASVDPTKGTTTLIEIDPQTGAASRLLDSISVMLVGLAWDPRKNTLYGLSSPSETAVSLPPSLHRIDIASGKTTLIGPTGKDLQGLTWIAPLGLVGTWDRFYLVNADSGQVLPVISGPEYVVGNGSGSYAIAANGALTLPPGAMPEPRKDIPMTLAIEDDQVKLRWTASVNTFYDVDYSPSLTNWNWKRLEQIFVGEEGRQGCGVTFTLPPGGSAEYEIEHLFDAAYKQGFYRIRATEFEATATTDVARWLVGGLLGIGLLIVRRWSQRPNAK